MGLNSEVSPVMVLFALDFSLWPGSSSPTNRTLTKREPKDYPNPDSKKSTP